MDDFNKTLTNIKIPRPIIVLQRIIIAFITLFTIIFAVLPWQQTARGFGYIIAFNPNNRAQSIHAPVNGRINKWFIKDGDKINEGDKIVEITDNDPLILDKLQADKNIKERKYLLAKTASETSKLNYNRQKELLEQGLSSRKNYEDAKIEYQKLLAATETANAELIDSSIKLSRQESSTILAPSKGTILKVLAGDNSTIVKSGDKIASFAPELQDPAVELYINGNDIPLVYEGRKVRLQFEGWPAIQFSGWPEIAIGTFSGIVSSVDSSVSENGKFRVIVSKDPAEKWPDSRFLKHGAKVYGWILLNKVKLGYELWRQINGFPPDFDSKTQIKQYND